MKWHKKGLIYRPNGDQGWMNNSALTPTPILLNSETIRVYAGFRDEAGISRIGFVDVSADNPSEIIRVSEKPCLDIGRDGCFDDNGIILGDVVYDGSQYRMYYIGFQLVNKVKFLAFSGLALSRDGESFERYSETPVLDRHAHATFIGAIHTVLKEDNQWRVWYSIGDDWQMVDGKSFPQYEIWGGASSDGIHIQDRKLEIPCEGEEYRIGRPSVYKVRDKYLMFYTWGTPNGDYLPGVAISDDGRQWRRKDELLGIALSEEGWDSVHLCYPRLVMYKDKTYMFYNGNNMGIDGFGYAELEGDLLEGF